MSSKGAYSNCLICVNSERLLSGTRWVAGKITSLAQSSRRPGPLLLFNIIIAPRTFREGHLPGNALLATDNSTDLVDPGGSFSTAIE